MKKLLLVNIFIFYSFVCAFAQTKKVSEIPHNTCKEAITILNWNNLNLETANRKEKLNLILEISKQADILLLQSPRVSEISENSISELVNALRKTQGGDWDYYISDINRNQGKSRFAEIWQSNKLKFLKPTKSAIQERYGNLQSTPSIACFYSKGNGFNLYGFNFSIKEEEIIGEAKKIIENKYFYEDESQIFLGDFNVSHKILDEYFEKQLNMKHQIEGDTYLGSTKIFARDHINLYVRGKIEICETGIIDIVNFFDNFDKILSITDHLPVYTKIYLR